MSQPILEVEKVSKKLVRNSMGILANENLRETIVKFYSKIIRAENNDSVEFLALRDVSLQLFAGDRLLLIGANGAGKSTLLKIIARITKPSEGRVKIRGKVAAILGIGAGIHHELTGRENIYFYGALLGMRRKDLFNRFDQIVDFADVGAFLDTPVKRYSSGMQTRLAFAVASHVGTDILLLDEVLAVGDAAFREKCMKRMQEIAKDGVATIMVTHSQNNAKALCNRGLLLKSGSVVIDGNVDQVVAEYSKP